MRADHLPLYGYNRNTAPNLNAWARNAFVFDNYFAASYLTPISEMSVQTGLYPTSNGVVGFNAPLAEHARPLAEILNANGYTTAAIGSSPEFYDVTSGRMGEAMIASFRRGFNEYFRDYYTRNPNEIEMVSPPVAAPENWKSYSWPEYYRGLPFGALDWLQQNRREKFFLWLPIGTAHWPYNIGRPFTFTDREYDGWLKDRGLAWFGGAVTGDIREIYGGQRWRNGTPAPISAADVQFIRDRYDDGIYLTDLFLGELFRAVRQNGLAKNTIVIIESEHGEELGERGYFAHYDVFDEEVRVPLIMKVPRLAPKRVSELVSGVDVMPALLAALDITPPSNINGESFLQYLAATPPRNPFREYIFIERIPPWEHVIAPMAKTDPQFKWLADFASLDSRTRFRDLAIRTNDWKLIFRESREIQTEYSWWGRLTGKTPRIAEYELYDLRNDPAETRNVIGQYSDIAAKLSKALLDWKSDIDAHTNIGPPTNPLIQPYF